MSFARVSLSSFCLPFNSKLLLHFCLINSPGIRANQSYHLHKSQSMSDRRSSPKVVLTHGSHRSSIASLSSTSSSNRSSTYITYGYSTSATSATSNMGRGYSERARETVLRVPDPYPTRETISTFDRGKVTVTNQEKRHEDRNEPRSYEAKSSDFRKSSSSKSSSSSSSKRNKK